MTTSEENIPRVGAYLKDIADFGGFFPIRMHIIIAVNFIYLSTATYLLLKFYRSN